jgi:two-component system, OmpR family, response regulator
MARKAAPYRLLLVDDDGDCLTALSNRLRFALRDQRVEVDVAESAATGVILAHSAHYDALIVDLLLPGVTRFKFIEQLAHIQPEAPIIVMSGFDMERCEEEVHRLGLTAFLPKPIDFAQLRRGLMAVLPHRSTQVRYRIMQHLVGPARAGLVRRSRFDRPN